MTHVSIGQPDVTLMLDFDGIIRNAVLSGTIPGEGVGDWVGRPWADTVGDVGGDRVRSMVEDARTAGYSAFRQVTQRFPSGIELPIEYTTVRLGGKAGLIAVGKNLQAVAELQSRLMAAQHAREQDYWRLREVETKSRLLFDASSEAMLMVRAGTLRIVEANPAAIRLLGLSPGWDFLREVALRDHDAFRAMLHRARENGRAPGVVVHLGSDGAAWAVRASVMATDPGALFLLQLAPVGTTALPVPVREVAVPMEELLGRLPDGFVIADREGRICRANQAFLDLVEMGARAAVVGEPLGRWLSQPGADAGVLFGLLRQRGAVPLFATMMTGELGTVTPVELAASAAGDDGAEMVALVIRAVGGRLPEADADRLSAEIGAVAGQIGTVPLPALVRSTAAAVERHCIEVALGKSRGKRTAAAELLGLSRQSLYVKLNRYGIDDSHPASGEEPE